MADPQLENGYTRIADELLEALCRAQLTARQYSVVLALVRKTYGYGKKRDQLSASQLEELTGIARSKIPAVLTELARLRVIEIHGERRHGKIPTLSIQKDHSRWGLKHSEDAPKLVATEMPPTRLPDAPKLVALDAPKLGAHNREETIDKKESIKSVKRVRFGKLLPLLAPDTVDAWIAIRPGGREYSADEVQAFYLAARPALVAADKEPLSSARKLFASAKPHQVRQAVLWVETQALEAMRISDDRALDSFDDFVEAFGLHQ